MITTRRLAMAGLASLTLAVSTLALPMSYTANAMSHEGNAKQPQKLLQLGQESNEAVDVSTDLDCQDHQLTARVTNKTDATIHPNVTFNNEAPTIPSTLPIEPGKTGSYFYNYSGNNQLVTVSVQGDTLGTVETSPTLNCTEPVSFKVQETSDSAIVGRLTNNSTLVPQTVYTKVGNGDTRVETLEKGQAKTIALPFESVSGQIATTVKIGTPAGYEGTYWVELNKLGPITPPVPVTQ